MSQQFQRILAGLSIVAGLFLVVVEGRGILAGQASQEWFWLLVGIALLVLGAMEFLPAGRRG
jgi:hypothetical protein